MTTKDSQVLCPTCRQDVPAAIKDLDYFAQNCLRPAADDVGCFLDDLRDLSAYMEALFKMLSHLEESALDYAFLGDCLNLGWALASESRRRHALAEKAWALVEKRLYPDIAAAIAAAQAD